jgi:hypothetical protein
MSNIHFNAQKKRRETKQGQVEIIETLNNPAEVISRQKKTEVMENTSGHCIHMCKEK